MLVYLITISDARYHEPKKKQKWFSSVFLPQSYFQSFFWWHRCPHHSISVGNFGSNHGWKLVEAAASHSKICKEFFLDGYASLHTICGIALSVVFDLQVDAPKTTSFSLPWFLAEECTQQPTWQNPYRTHWQIVRKCENVAFLSPSVRTAKKYSAAAAVSPLGQKTAVHASP